MQASSRHNSWNTYQKCFKLKFKQTRKPKIQPKSRKTPQTAHASHKQHQRKGRRKERVHTMEGMEEKQ